MARLMAEVYLGLGSNVSPEDNLKLGLGELRRRYGPLDVSTTYRNVAFGFAGEDFLNLVVGMKTNDSPQSICDEIELIHNVAGRTREGNKWESRPLDIDLLLYNDLICEQRPVRVPRDDVLKYSFVLRPLAELVPEMVHPITRRTLIEHWREFDASSHPLEEVSVDW